MLRRTKMGPRKWRYAWILLLSCVLICAGSEVELVLAQLDLSVFQKEGTSEEQQSKDRHACHRAAVQRTGFDPAIAPPDDYPPMRPEEEAELKAQQAVEWRKQQQKYNNALKRCMEDRGYSIVEH